MNHILIKQKGCKNKMQTEYTSHERKPVIDAGLRDLLPPLDADALEALIEDILKNGCYSPLIVMEDMTLVDGHNRYSVCEQHNIPYRMVVLPFEDKLAAKQWALDTQKGRRNLTAWEIGQIALKLKPDIEEKARINMGTRTDLSATLPKGLDAPVDTRKELAQASGIGERTMGKIMQIDENAPMPIKDALDKKEISINKGYNLTKQLEDLPEDEREAAAVAMLESEYQQDCREIDRKTDVAKLFNVVMEKVSLLDPTAENVWLWVEWSGIRTDAIDSLIEDVDKTAGKFMRIKEILETEVKQYRRNPSRSAPGGRESEAEVV